MEWVTILSLILTEAPKAIDLLFKLRSEGRTQASDEELREAGLADSDFNAAYSRLFPGQTPPAA
jgi:hypothetical protein